MFSLDFIFYSLGYLKYKVDISLNIDSFLYTNNKIKNYYYDTSIDTLSSSIIKNVILDVCLLREEDSSILIDINNPNLIYMFVHDQYIQYFYILCEQYFEYNYKGRCYSGHIFFYIDTEFILEISKENKVKNINYLVSLPIFSEITFDVELLSLSDKEQISLVNKITDSYKKPFFLEYSIYKTISILEKLNINKIKKIKKNSLFNNSKRYFHVFKRNKIYISKNNYRSFHTSVLTYKKDLLFYKTIYTLNKKNINFLFKDLLKEGHITALDKNMLKGLLNHRIVFFK